MPTIAWEEATRATLFVRANLPTPAKRSRETMISRLEELVASGVIQAFSVSSWAKRVPLDAGSERGRAERDLFDQFTAWAGTAGVTLSPFFDTRECYSSTTGERETQIVMPAACVAFYDGADELLGVTPYARESGSVSIGEGFDRLTNATSDDGLSVSMPMAD